LNILPNALNAMDQPTMDGINTYIVAKAVKESGVTVALSGLGGDELFAGYPSFLRALRMEKIRRIPVSLRIFASKLGSKFLSNSYTRKKFWALVGSEGDPEAAYRISRQLFAVDEIQNLLNEPYFPDALSEQEDIPDSIYAVSVRELQGYMSNTLLRDTDCMSMAHALEVRVPFVDSMIVRFVLNLPGKWKINGNRPKPLLLDVMKNLLPEAIWRRPKMGFILPFERWLRTSLYGELNEIYRNVENLKRLGFQANFARDIWRTFQERPHKERWSRSWALYVLMKWCEINEIESFSRGRDFVGNG
jgi:asparagine synthase (glutamine-hydrolysing)